jgi:uncharacterized membrane protein (DUF106 family)
MVNLMRKFQQPLMIFVTIIIIICFAWLYNSNTVPGDRSEADIAGKLYGRPVTGAEFKRMVRMLNISQLLGLNELMEGLGSTPRPNSRGEMQEN